MGYSPWGRKESDTTERLSLTLAHLRKQLEKEMATHSSVLAWRIPMGRGTWWAIVHGVKKSWI